MADEKKPKNIFEIVVRWFMDTANWIQENLGEPEFAKEIRADLGLKPGKDIPPARKGQFAQFAQGLDPDKAAFAETIAELQDAIPVFSALGDELKDDSLTGWDVAFLLARVAAVSELRFRAPIVYSICKALLLLTDDPDEVEMFNVDMLVKLLRGDDFPPGTGERILGKLIPSLGLGLLEQLLIDAKLPADLFDFYYGWDPAPGSPTPKADDVASGAGTLLMRFPRTGTAQLDWALTMIHVRPDQGGPGLFLALNAFGKLETQVPETNTTIKLLAGAPGQVNIFIPFGDSAAHRFEADATAGNGFIRAELLQGSQESPFLRIGEKDKTRLDVAQMLMGLELAKDRAATRLGFKGAKLTIDIAKDADGFLRSVAGGKSETTFDFTLIADARNGLRVEGGAGMSATFPIGATLFGALTVHHIALQLGPGKNNHDLGLEVAGAFAVNIGPFKASIDRMGMTFDLSFRDGNLGFIDLSLGFKPPNGIGLVLDAGVVKGGGFLFIDVERGEYAGALELQFAKFGLKAIAILSTRMSDGSAGWSLLLLIYGQFFPPIQLSWGFTLNAVGGMIGLQHGMNIEALTTSMRTGALDDVLFPKDPVADAPRIINRLRTIFPPTPRVLVFGPMLELGWGTPSIIRLRLGLLLQLDNVFGGDRPASIKRIILLGQLIVQLPPPVQENKPTVLKLLVDFLGYYDFDEQRLEFAARLRDSKVIGLTLSGMLYVRSDFGDRPIFILAAGGFHPKFADLPPGLPSPIDRLKISFDIGTKVKLLIQAYFAITPATVQFGAEVQISAKFGVELSGLLGFDAICFLEPRFFFEADIRAGVKVKFKGHTLGGVTLELHLEGPGRWRANGKVTFSILFWDVSKSFDESWGTTPEIAPTLTNVAQQLRTALADPHNWRAQLPLGDAPVVTLAFAEGETDVLAHPLGQLQVMQQIVPLGLELQHFGNTRVTGARKFDISQVRVGAQVVASPEPAVAFFARSQFVDMTNEQKLTAPSFEPFPAGVTVGTIAYRAAPEMVASDLDFETAYLQPDDPLRRSSRDKVSLGIDLDRKLFQAQVRRGAAARSVLRVKETLQPKVNRKVKVNT